MSDTTLASRWHTLLAVDHDRWAAETYRANFPGVPVVTGSVADQLATLPYADVVLGGPPCQPHSLAGNRKASADERDGGADFVAAVARVGPRMFLMENVPGLLTSENGTYAHNLLAALEAAGRGYVVQIKTLDAVNYGVPQFRRRCWWWGIRSDVYAAGVRHGWPVPTHAWPPPGPSMFGGELAAGVTVGEALGLDGYLQQSRGPRWQDEARQPPTTEPSPTVPATSKAGGGGGLLHVVRVFGGGRNHPADADGVYRRDKRDITDEPSTTIVDYNGATTPTLHADLEIGPDQLARIAAYEWASGCVESRDLKPDRPARTLTAKNAAGTSNDALRIVAENWKRKGDLWVRRLAPLECARLQSVPDAFRWPDNLPKTHAYRVIGNGWASGMAVHMSRALAAADPDSRTTIDLYCGGGLGAVGWHGRFWSYARNEVAA